MAIRVDTYVTRIDLATEPDPGVAIKGLCDQQAARDEARRLTAAFALNSELILIFQVAADSTGRAPVAPRDSGSRQ